MIPATRAPLPHSACRAGPGRVPGALFGRTARLPRARAEGKAAAPSCCTRQPLRPGSRSPDETRLRHCALAVPTLRGQVYVPERTHTDPLLPLPAPEPAVPHPVLPSLCPAHNGAAGRDWLPDPDPNHSRLETAPSCREGVSQPAAAAHPTRALLLTVPRVRVLRGIQAAKCQEVEISAPATVPTVRMRAHATAEVCKRAVKAAIE